MADNVAITAGSGTAIAADDISSVWYQRVKPAWGADGSATDASVAAPLPVQSTIESNQMTGAGTVLTPKFAAIAASTSGANTLVAAVAAKKIRVLSYTLVTAGAVTCRFEDGAGGTAKSGVMSFAANGGVSVPFSPVGHFETTANTLLNLELGGAVSVAGHICYVEV